ncbi:lipopolysaccharide biosynthesis protein [Kitasatospora sp. NPDC059571]|uniref:lipopolysaccharide biosynthesis protein n=1 Tax=Kitasatospora sp. NPDC059571 TaxID=3346871 RepID=UPI003673E330
MRRTLSRLAGALPPGTQAVAGGTVVMGIASYVHLGVAGHNLTVGAMANVSVLWTITMSIGIGLFFPIEQELTRIVAARTARDRGATPVVRRATALTAAVLGAVLLALGLAADPIAAALFHGDRGLVAALGAAFAGMAASYLTRGVLAGLGRFTAYGTQLATDGALRILLAFACALFGLHSDLAFSLVLAVAPVTAVLLTLPPLLRGLRPGPPIGWRELCGDLGLLICSTLLAQLVVNAVVVSTKLLAPTDAALIAALLNALVLARVPLFVFGSLQASLLSGLSTAIAAGDRAAFARMLRRITTVVTLLGLAGGIPAVLLGPWLIQVLFAAEPVLGPLDFLWMSLGTIAYMLAMILGQALMVLHRHAQQLLCWVAGTVVLAAVTFAPGDVATRVVLAYALGSAVTVLGMLAALRRAFPGAGTSGSGPGAQDTGRVEAGSPGR